jgi:hypothetical protein
MHALWHFMRYVLFAKNSHEYIDEILMVILCVGVVNILTPRLTKYVQTVSDFVLFTLETKKVSPFVIHVEKESGAKEHPQKDLF